MIGEISGVQWGLKREVVLADFEGPESYSGGLKIRKAPKTKI